MTANDRLLEIIERYEELRERGESPTPEQLCADCPDMISQVRQTIQKLRGIAPLLDGTVQRALVGQTLTGDPELPTDAFTGSRYHPVDFCARGGQGEVYLAHDDVMNREVALKRIKPRRGDQTEMVRRFLREAEICGRLQHPGIVPVYDLGRDAGGQPFYAMRFIEGESMADALRRYHATGVARRSGERELAFRQLLTRFVSACNAVAYAHNKGVIHRDIKPSNIMLGPFGETLVVDWGLAKTVTLEPNARDEASFIVPVTNDSNLTTPDPCPMTTDGTRAGHAVGTPAYMSPEQAEGAHESVGPAADIFSLGATLRTIIAGDPNPLAESKNPAPSALIAICDKAMTGDPSARYASASELAAEVERWLADEPVSAAREPRIVKVRRWMRRHQRLVAGVSVAVLIGMAWLIQATIAMSQNSETYRLKEAAARESAVRAQESASKALREQRTAQRMTELITSIFESADPFGVNIVRRMDKRMTGGSPTIQHLLDVRTDDLREQLKDEPEALAKVLGVIGNSHRALNNFDLAEELLREALKTIQDLPESSQMRIEAMMNLGWALHESGKFDEAVELLRPALARMRSMNNVDPILLSNCIFGLASLYAFTGDGQQSESLFLEALDLRIKQLGPNHRQVAIAKCGLAALYLDTGRPREAMSEVMQARTILEQIEGFQSFGLSLSEYQEGEGKMFERNPQAAQRHFENALAQLRKTVGDRHWMICFISNGVARALDAQGKFVEAEDVYRKTLSLANESLGMRHPMVVYWQGTLNDFLVRRGRLEKADQENLALIRKLQSMYGPDHVFAADAKAAYALALKENGQIARGTVLMNEAIGSYRKPSRLIGKFHGEALIHAGLMCYRNNDLKGAEAYFDEGMPILRKRYGPDGMMYLDAKVLQATAIAQMGRLEEAVGELEPIIDISRPEKKGRPEIYRIALVRLAQIRRAQKRIADADKILSQIRIPPSAWMLPDAQLTRAEYAAEAGDLGKSSRFLTEAEETCLSDPSIPLSFREEAYRRKILVSIERKKPEAAINAAEKLAALVESGSVDATELPAYAQAIMLSPESNAKTTNNWLEAQLLFMPSPDGWCVLGRAMRTNPERDPNFLKIRGAARVLAGNVAGGKKDLEISRSRALRSNDSPLWQDLFLAFADCQLGANPDARSKFVAACKAINDAPPDELPWNGSLIWRRFANRAAKELLMARLNQSP